MEYDYRKQGGGSTPRPGMPNLTGYDTQKPLYPGRYERSGSGATGSGSSSHFYPRIAQPVGSSLSSRPPAPVSHPSPTSGTGIRMAIKAEYRVTPAVQLILPQNADVPRSLFTFDFELERKILAEFERESQGWDPSRANGEASPVRGVEEDPVVAKYLAMGLNKEAAIMAVATFGDVQNKPYGHVLSHLLKSCGQVLSHLRKLYGRFLVLEFVSSYNLLREMGFPPVPVAGALAMYDNDRERALAHFV